MKGPITSKEAALLRRRIRFLRWHLGKMAKQKIVDREECAWLLKNDRADDRASKRGR